MLTQRDPDVNMLRATIAAFSAGLGGANSINVLPHTLALGLPDAFARRIARNTQLVLLEESNLDKVSDPAAGSGGIETLTKQLCEAAWAQFQDIEKAGGPFAALETNIIQTKVAAVRAARDVNIAKRKDVLTGASEFPNLHEKTSAVLDAKPVTGLSPDEVVIRFDPLAPIRLAAPFEALRDVSDQILNTSGKRPRVFLANLGTAADFTARATFAKSFFETGGIEAIDTEGFSDPAALATAFKSSGAALVCLCSSDKVYAARAEAVAKALHDAGAKAYLSGRPARRTRNSAACCWRRRIHLRRRRCPRDAQGGLRTYWVKHEGTSSRSDRRLPMWRCALCVLHKSGADQRLSLPDVSEGGSGPVRLFR